SLLPRPPHSPLFPYTTLFRSLFPVDPMIARQAVDDRRGDEVPGTLARCAAREDLALRPLDLLDRLVVRRDRGFVDEGSEVHVSRSEEHTSELQSRFDLVCRLL